MVWFSQDWPKWACFLGATVAMKDWWFLGGVTTLAWTVDHLLLRLCQTLCGMSIGSNLLKRIGDSHTRKKLHLALRVSHLLSESWGYGVYASSCAAIIEFLSLIHSTILYLTQNQSYSSRATNHQVPVPIVLGSLGREKWLHFKTCVQHRVNDFLLAQRLEIWPFRGSCLLRKHVLDLFHIFHSIYIYIHHIIFMLHPTRSPSKCFAFYPIFRIIWCQNHLKPM